MCEIYSNILSVMTIKTVKPLHLGGLMFALAMAKGHSPRLFKCELCMFGESGLGKKNNE